jgi:hypothetical protein
MKFSIFFFQSFCNDLKERSEATKRFFYKKKMFFNSLAFIKHTMKVDLKNVWNANIRGMP